jgi:DNA-directed RNA polymerase subunit RPC12/RpoP
MNYYCKYCGSKNSSIVGLTNSACQRHPLGALKGKHTLYEGAEKAKYECKYCGTSNASIVGLTNSACQRHPLGALKGHHEPAM